MYFGTLILKIEVLDNRASYIIVLGCTIEALRVFFYSVSLLKSQAMSKFRFSFEHQKICVWLYYL